MKIISAITIGLVLCVAAVAQTKNFTPVDGATLKAKIDSAIITGKANTPGGTTDGTSMMFDLRHETHELGLFLLYDVQRDSFTRADIYNLRRTHEFSNYPVYWAGHITNEESLNHLKSIVDSPAPEVNRLAERALFAIALHDDARVDAILIDMIRRPVAEPLRSRAIYWLGNNQQVG